MTAHDREQAGRLIFDVSSLVRWVGPPVGMIRVERELAAYVRAERPDVVLSVYDRSAEAFRPLRPDWADAMIGLQGAIDIATLDRRRTLPLWRKLLPSRYPVLIGLERLRLVLKRRGAGEAPARLVAVLQRALMTGAQAHPFRGRDGERYDVIPLGLAWGPALRLTPADLVVSAGYDWLHKDIGAIAAAKRRQGFRYVVLCYDLIPLLHPEFFPAGDVDTFRSHWSVAFPTADLVVVTAERIARDVRLWCAGHGLPSPPVVVAPLGYRPDRPRDGSPDASSKPLPRGLEPGRFILYVSTVEPRKGHAMLLDVWERLLREGIPRRHGMRLALVGRRGWTVDDVLRRIERLGDEDGMLVHLSDLPDEDLDGLYRQAAFCVYPSLYEGYGLPLLEAFARGKAVIASNGGALPETADGLAPCLDPGDRDAWYEGLKGWIERPDSLRLQEAAIRASFRHLPWAVAAATFFDTVERLSGSTPVEDGPDPEPEEVEPFPPR